MRNMILFVTVATVIITAMWIGVSRSRVNAMPIASPEGAGIYSSSESATATAALPPAKAFRQSVAVPNRGSVQVLNGCGEEGAANRVADFLRSKAFDVKDIGNASSWNHRFTMVILRTADKELAGDIAKWLKTDKLVLMRNGDSTYDVTVVAGPDFEERIGVSRSRVNAMPIASPEGAGIYSSSTLSATAAKQPASVPGIGSVQVLNGCGKEGAASRVADFLISKGFGVKDIGNAADADRNRPFTQVISSTAAKEQADKIAKTLNLKMDKLILLESNDSPYDVTVVVGPDFEERIK